jgi:hypothetical protein
MMTSTTKIDSNKSCSISQEEVVAPLGLEPRSKGPEPSRVKGIKTL